MGFRFGCPTNFCSLSAMLRCQQTYFARVLDKYNWVLLLMKHATHHIIYEGKEDWNFCWRQQQFICEEAEQINISFQHIDTGHRAHPANTLFWGLKPEDNVFPFFLEQIIKKIQGYSQNIKWSLEPLRLQLRSPESAVKTRFTKQPHLEFNTLTNP